MNEKVLKSFGILGSRVERMKCRILELFVFTLIVVSPVTSLAQSSPQPSASPTPSPTPSLERRFIANILKDQRAIWTSPFHLTKQDARWLVPLGVTSAALLASDN
jgi:hypothetical protein